MSRLIATVRGLEHEFHVSLSDAGVELTIAGVVAAAMDPTAGRALSAILAAAVQQWERERRRKKAADTKTAIAGEGCAKHLPIQRADGKLACGHCGALLGVL